MDDPVLTQHLRLLAGFLSNAVQVIVGYLAAVKADQKLVGRLGFDPGGPLAGLWMG